MSKAILIVLDGFGIGKDSPFNAINNAQMPFYKDLLNKYPHSQLLTHGNAVGLPDKVMGNSEVGHMTMGSGRIIYQDLTRISKSIHDGDFFKNTALKKAFEHALQTQTTLHLMGLLSDGGVHSHEEHLFALLDMGARLKLPRISIHCFLDGRDTPPDSSPKYIQQLLTKISELKKSYPATSIFISSIGGRYFAMDRDQRWERIEKAYKVLTGETESTPADALSVIEKSYRNGKSDEFIEPTLLNSSGTIQSSDAVIFFNYRADRARQISRTFTEKEFSHFKRKPLPQIYVGMTRYDDALKNMTIAYTPQDLSHLFAEVLESQKLSQFRIAETEKYAHVTFFFNGGREKPYDLEERLLIDSPKDVATYDLKPEMSARKVAEETRKKLESQKPAFVLVNFANADMIGHTGNYEAAVKAMECLDVCLSEVIGAAQKNGYDVLLTADHGNCEEMRDEQGKIHTQHTLNPVPALWIAPNTAIAPKSSRKPMKDGTLADIMPTLCHLMNLPIPAEVTGKNLIG